MIRFINKRGWHPVGLGLSLYLLGILAFNLFHIDVIENLFLSDLLIAFASVALVSITAGWAVNNSRMLSVGFILTGFTTVTRSVFIGVDHGWDAIGVWLGLAVGVIAIGSYVKEGHARQRERLNVARS
jgi:hypothetical protein